MIDTPNPLMPRRALWCGLIGIMWVSRLASAQDTPPVRALTDADYPRIRAALQTAARAATQGVGRDAGGIADVDAALGLIERIEQAGKGTIDMLAFYRARSTHVVIPPGARYDSLCSSKTAQVILTFGVPAADFHRSAYNLDAARASSEVALADLFARSSKRPENVWEGSRASMTAERAFRAAMTAYRAAGFRYEGREDVLHTFSWPDTERDSLEVLVAEFNRMPLHSCNHMASGPMVVIRFVSGAGTARLRATAKAAETRHDEMLERAGLDREQIDSIVRLADIARLDVDNEDALRTLQELPDETVKRETAIRMRNVAWYRRHAAVLGPLFEQAGYLVLKKDP